MREDEPIGRETLNSYVDGELPRADAARVARAAAQDTMIAAQIATLRELKAAIPEIVPPRAISLPPSGVFRRTPAGFAVAACLAMVVAAGIVHLLMQPAPESERWSRALQAQHQAWLFSPVSDGRRVELASGPAHLLPLDLKSAKLKFVGYRKVPVAGKQVLQTGYEGTRGCRVSLFVFPAEVAIDPGVFAPGLLVRSWTIHDQAFALMADGMAKTRFAGLSRAVEKALRAGSQPDPGMRQRLAQARRSSPPCQA